MRSNIWQLCKFNWSWPVLASLAYSQICLQDHERVRPVVQLKRLKRVGLRPLETAVHSVVRMHQHCVVPRGVLYCGLVAIHLNNNLRSALRVLRLLLVIVYLISSISFFYKKEIISFLNTSNFWFKYFFFSILYTLHIFISHSADKKIYSKMRQLHNNTERQQSKKLSLKKNE